jgi:hypothetical protein
MPEKAGITDFNMGPWIFLSVLCLSGLILVIYVLRYADRIAKEPLKIEDARAVVARKLLAANTLIESYNKNNYSYDKRREELARCNILLEDAAKYVKKYPELEKYFPISKVPGYKRERVILSGTYMRELELWAQLYRPRADKTDKIKSEETKELTEEVVKDELKEKSYVD